MLPFPSRVAESSSSSMAHLLGPALINRTEFGEAKDSLCVFEELGT